MVRVDPRMLLDTGLLFEINRTVLHPVGLALGVNNQDGSVSLHQVPETTGILFEEADLREGDRKFAEFMRSDGAKAHTARARLHGFAVQPPPDDSRWKDVRRP